MIQARDIIKKILLNEETIEKYQTRGGRYRIEVEKSKDHYNILYYSDGRESGRSVYLTYDEYKKELADTIEMSARMSKINYKKVL